MDDTFADLWDLSTPSKPDSSKTLKSATRHPSTSANANAPLTQKPQPDVFALLSSAGSSASNSRPLTPATLGRNMTANASVSKLSSDAFSGLFADSFGSGLQTNTRMTMAERAAMVEKTKRERPTQHSQPVKTEISAWDGLDALANRANTTAFAPSKPASHNNANALIDDWGIADFVARPASISSPPSEPSQTILDIDDFPSPVEPPQPAQRGVNGPVERFDALGDFDFGDREDHDSQDGDDILGILSQPVDALPERSSPTVRVSSCHSRTLLITLPPWHR